MRLTERPIRTHMAGTALNEKALRWSSATTISACGRRARKRHPIARISAMHASTLRRPVAPQAFS
jgi:hypothetical protein